MLRWLPAFFYGTSSAATVTPNFLLQSRSICLLQCRSMLQCGCYSTIVTVHPFFLNLKSLENKKSIINENKTKFKTNLTMGCLPLITYFKSLAWLWRSDLVRKRMRTCSKTSLNVWSLKLYHSCVKASSIDFSPLSIISARRSARSFANGCEMHLLRILDFLTPSEKRGINENWELSLIIFLFFQFFFSPDLSDRVVVFPSLRFPHTSNFFCSDTRPVSIDGEVVASIDVGSWCRSMVSGRCGSILLLLGRYRLHL